MPKLAKCPLRQKGSLDRAALPVQLRHLPQPEELIDRSHGRAHGRPHRVVRSGSQIAKLSPQLRAKLDKRTSSHEDSLDRPALPVQLWSRLDAKKEIDRRHEGAYGRPYRVVRSG